MRLPAEFVCSAPTLADCPQWSRIEVALAGRSNVGKSSLLNALAGRKNLARISRTPGRTRCLNFFAVGAELALVDLPGYGYAKMARSEAERVARLMEQYLGGRANLAALILLVDVRRGPEKEEFAFAQLADNIQSGGGLILAAAKSDKLKRSERMVALRRFAAVGRVPLLCSALSGEGIDELRRQIVAFAPAGRIGRSLQRRVSLNSDDA
jgi:GTP-binding protein